MSEISSAIESIRQAAGKAGLVELAREAGVPYTTVHSFSNRQWSHKNLDVLEKLAGAAQRINDRQESA
jgi:hypothetical protein